MGITLHCLTEVIINDSCDGYKSCTRLRYKRAAVAPAAFGQQQSANRNAKIKVFHFLIFPPVLIAAVRRALRSSSSPHLPS